MSKKNFVKVIVSILSIIVLIITGVIGYTVYQMKQAEELVFTAYTDDDNENNDKVYNGSWIVDVDKNNLTGVKTSVIQISNNSSDTVIKHFRLENSKEWEPYISSLTITIDGTNLISKDILKEDALDFKLSSDASCYAIIEYSFNQNITDTSNMPDSLQLTPVI